MNAQEPIAPQLDSLEPPVELAPVARAIWDQDAPVAQAMGTLTRADLTSFVTYCRLQALGDRFGDHAEATRAKRPSPATWAAVKAWNAAQALAGRFGLNASDRTRIRVTQDDGHKDPLEAARQKARAARAALRTA